jgi:hypothetical protein
MTIIKLTDKEAKIIRTILGNLADQIDEEIVNLIPNDITDEESDQFLDDTRATLAKLY